MKEKNESATVNLENFPACPQLQGKNHLFELDFDSLYTIFVHLDIIDLTNVVRADEAMLDTAVSVAKRKFGNQKFQIMESILHFNGYNQCHENFESVIINNYAMALLVLEYFGLYISHLEIYYKYEGTDRVKCIVHHVNRYCENLVKFKLETSTIDPLDDVTKPFHNILELSISAEFEKFGNAAFSLNEMFPNIRQLNMENLKLKNYDDLNINMPHLESLGIEYMFRPYEFDHFKKFIMKNPQIRHIRITDVYLSFVNFVNQILPNLETLEIHLLSTDVFIPEIHLKNVTKFKINGIILNQANMGKFTFEANKLEELECQWSFECTEMLRSNRNIKKFSIPLDSSIVAQKIPIISQNAPNLIEASFSIGYGIVDDTIIQFLNANEHLNRLYLYFEKEESITQYKIDWPTNRISDEWTFKVEKHSTEIFHFPSGLRALHWSIFERKN